MKTNIVAVKLPAEGKVLRAELLVVNPGATTAFGLAEGDGLGEGFGVGEAEPLPVA